MYRQFDISLRMLFAEALKDSFLNRYPKLITLHIVTFSGASVAYSRDAAVIMSV